LKNALQWSNFIPYKEMSTKNNFFHIAGGILHDYTYLKYRYTPYNSLYLFARSHIRLFKVLDINLQASYLFLSDYSNNDIMAKARISWTMNKEKAHRIGINVNFYRNQPEYVLLHVEQNNFRWVNQFKYQNIAQLKAFWNYENYSFSASYYYLNNLVYLSEALRPVQAENNGNMIQLSSFIPYRYKNFGVTSNLNIQYCTNEVVYVPIFAGKLSAYYIFEFIKKRLKILIGTDIMYNTTYYANGYMPALHTFYCQTTQPIGNFLYMDLNMTVSIDRINFFVRVGNLLSPLMGKRDISTPNYPLNNYMFNLGISWKFYD
jgi:hypothetical protein